MQNGCTSATLEFPHNIFMDNRIVVGIGFLAISGFIGRAFRKLLKTE
jgi:hypothetical protein